jgi:hypothetical protein
MDGVRQVSLAMRKPVGGGEGSFKYKLYSVDGQMDGSMDRLIGGWTDG